MSVNQSLNENPNSYNGTPVVSDLKAQINTLQTQIQQLTQADQSPNTGVPSLQSQINTISSQMTNVITYDDIPVGSNLAKEFNQNFGDLDIIETTQNSFVFGNSIWGTARIGGPSTS